jgi:hypothetical protein
LHLVDPEVYPDPGDDPNITLPPLRPGPIHFLRRMKEDLVDYDGKTRLFKNRTAADFGIPLSALEFGFYKAALDMVDQFFPPVAQPLARIVYGKRAASTLEALARTLQRRHDHVGEKSEAEAVMDADRDFAGDAQATQRRRRIMSYFAAIDEDVCAAHGDCADLAPEVFEVDDALG